MLNYLETWHATVTAEQCDHLGHMNVQFYIAAVNDGGTEMLKWLGVSRDSIAKRRLAFAAVRMEIDYLKELREGEQIVLETAVESVAEKSIILRHRLKLAETGQEAMANKVSF